MRPRAAPHAVVFDLDGTLVDSAPGIADALSRLRGERGFAPVDETAVRRLVSLGADVLVRAALGEAAGEPGDDLARFRDILRALPTQEAWLYPDVRAVLGRARTLDLRLGIVTNKPEGLARRLLDDLALSDQFGVVIGGDTVAPAKPDAAPLRVALQRLEVAAEAAVYVGDSVVDATCAERAGVRFALFLGGYGAAETPPELVTGGTFAAFSDLPPLLGWPAVERPAADLRTLERA